MDRIHEAGTDAGYGTDRRGLPGEREVLAAHAEVGRRHLHFDQDEWIYVIEGEFGFHVGDKRLRAGIGESVFLPRQVPHGWACVSGKPGKIIDVYQPAGKMGEFFRALGKYHGRPFVHEVLIFDEFSQLFHDHGMDLVGPPLVGEWKVEEDGRITQLA